MVKINVSTATVEEWRVKFIFKPSDSGRKGRLRDEKLFSSSADMFFFSDHLKIVQLR